MLLGALFACALAQDPQPEPEPEPVPETAPEPEAPPPPTTPILDPEEDEPPSKKKPWGGIAIPLVTYNSTDGLAVGLGGEIFERSPAGGYLRKITFQALVSIDGKYQSHLIRYDTRTGKYDVLAEVGFHAWTNHLYAGSGGQDVSTDWGEAEGNNVAWSPYVTVGATQPLGPGLIYQQAIVKFMQVVPDEGGLLDERAPTGVQGGWYFDVTGGWYTERFDRWPLPTDGYHLEIDARLGGALVDDKEGFLPQAGLHFEASRWWPVAGPRFVIGTRANGGWAFGDRPFFEEEFIGGRRRAEIGYDKALTGYGRTRTRAPGVLAALVEARPFFYRTKHKFFDIGFYGSLYAEEAFLFTTQGPGPHMPTIGLGPVLLWQDAVMLRPFVAWGWKSDSPTDPRKATPQFGLVLTDPL